MYVKKGDKMIKINDLFETIKTTKIGEKILNNKIIKNSIIMFSTQSIAGFIGIINSLLIVKGVGIGGNGIIALVIAYSALFNGLFNFQSYHALIKFGAVAKENNKTYRYKMYIKLALLQDITTAIIATFIGYICLDKIALVMNWDSQMIYYTKLYLITIPFNITGSLNAVFRLNDEFSITGIISIYANIFKFFLIIISFFFNLNILFYIIIEIIYSISINVIRFIYALKSLKKQKLLDFIKSKIIFDKDFTKYNILNNLVTAIDIPTGQAVNLIINMILGVESVGVYSLLVKLGSIVTQITDSIGQSIFPEFSLLLAKQKITEAVSISKKMLKFTIFLGVISFFIVFFSYPFWLQFLINKTNVNYGLSFALYTLFLFISSAILPIHALFLSGNLMKFNLIIVAFCNIIYLIFMLLLGNVLGLIGIILASLLQVTILSYLKIYILKKNMLWL